MTNHLKPLYDLVEEGKKSHWYQVCDFAAQLSKAIVDIEARPITPKEEAFPTLDECMEDAKSGVTKDSLENGELDHFAEHLIGSTWAFIEGRVKSRDEIKKWGN